MKPFYGALKHLYTLQVVHRVLSRENETSLYTLLIQYY